MNAGDSSIKQKSPARWPGFLMMSLRSLVVAFELALRLRFEFGFQLGARFDLALFR